MTRSVAFRAVAILAALFVGSACGTGDPRDDSDLASESADRISPDDSIVLAAMEERIHSLQIALPSFRIEDYSPGTDGQYAADHAVSGRVVEVVAGRSFTWDLVDETGEGSETRREVPFNDKESMSTTVHVTLEVSAATSKQDRRLVESSTIQFGLAFGPQVDVDLIERDLIGLGTLAILLFEDTAVYSYDDQIYEVFLGGAALGVVNDRGNVEFPALAGFGEAMSTPSKTVQQLIGTEVSRPQGR